MAEGGNHRAPGFRAGSGRAFLVAVLFLAPAFAGCITQLESAVYVPVPPPEPTDPRLDKNGLSIDRELSRTHETVRFPSFDGIELEADVWRPVVNATEKVPVVIIISPYFLGAKAELPDPPGGGTYGDTVKFLVPRGYAVALVDLRGTRNSDGCVDLAGPAERGDAYAAVEFFGEQSWSNGKVGMIGVSYDGLTQIEAAAMNPPHLAAIVPIAPVTDWYHAVGKGGAKYTGWTPMTPFGYNFNYGMEVNNPNPDRKDVYIDRAPHQDCAIRNQVGSDDLSGDLNDWMKARDMREMGRNSTAPMFYVHGLLDVNARPDHIVPWYNNYGGPKKAYLWQFPHASPNDANTGRALWFNDVIKWFDHWLLDIPNGVEATLGTVEVQDNFGRWRYEEAWPPEDITDRTFLLGPGTLTDAPADAEPQTWRENPFEDSYSFGFRSGRVGDSQSDSRLVFAGEELAEDVHYVGRPAVDAYISSTRENSFVVAHLYEIQPDGSWVYLNRGVHSIRHRDGIDNPKPGTPGEVYRVHVEMQPVDYVFQKGHAIGLTITSNDRSYIGIAPPAGGNVIPTGIPGQGTGQAAVNTLYHDGTYPSALILPEVKGRTQFHHESWGGAQPTYMGPDTRMEASS